MVSFQNTLNLNLKKLLNQSLLKLMKKFKENNKLKLVKQKAHKLMTIQ